ncbi:MAG: hypothetical protein V4724_32490 [Pseudomonadota bacterium]
MNFTGTRMRAPWTTLLHTLTVLWLAGAPLHADAATTFDAGQRQRIETRYGNVEVRESADSTALLYRGEVLHTITAASAALYRITPQTQREYILVQAWHPGLYCHHFYLLLDLPEDGAAQVSKEFGECTELNGAGFAGPDPVIHLKEPAIAGKKTAPGVIDYVWRQGDISPLPAAPGTCEAVALAAKSQARRADADDEASTRRVIGSGRLQFMSSPSEGCRQAGVFIIPGDVVNISLHYLDYTYVRYWNPRRGKEVEGWVRSERLAEVN